MRQNSDQRVQASPSRHTDWFGEFQKDFNMQSTVTAFQGNEILLGLYTQGGKAFFIPETAQGPGPRTSRAPDSEKEH